MPGWVTRGNNWYYVNMNCEWAITLVAQVQELFCANGLRESRGLTAKGLNEARPRGSWERGRAIAHAAQRVACVTSSPGKPISPEAGPGPSKSLCGKCVEDSRNEKVARILRGPLTLSFSKAPCANKKPRIAIWMWMCWDVEARGLAPGSAAGFAWKPGFAAGAFSGSGRGVLGEMRWSPGCSRGSSGEWVSLCHFGRL